MTLRVTVDHKADATRKSLLSRLALANGYSSLQAFLALNGASVLPFERGEPEALEQLSDWSGIPFERLSSFDIKSREKDGAWTVGPATMSRDMRAGLNHRYCPKCVMDDIENGTGHPATRPYVRAAWMTRAVQTCVWHGCPIVEAATSIDARDDFAQHVARNLKAIEIEAADRSSGETEVARYVTARIEGTPANVFLDQFETYVAVDLCRNIGLFKVQHDSDQALGSPSPAVREVDIGFGIASRGPDCIEALIREAVARERPLALEMQGFFGKLRRWLLRNKAKDDFTNVIELFQGIAERNLPIGKDELFVLPTRQRHLHSVRSASLAYGILDERVYQLVLDAGLTEPSKLSNGRIYFNANEGDKVLSSALDTLTTPDMASQLGVHIDRMRAIFDANLLQRVETSQDGRVYSRVRRADFEAFKERLNIPEATANERQTLLPVGRATQTAICTVTDIVSLVFNGKLKSLRRLNQDGVISGLGVDVDELSPLIVELKKAAAETTAPLFDLTDPMSALLTTRQARARLGTAPGTVKELLRLNYLKFTKGLNPKTGRTNDYICSKSVERFLSRHISLAHLSDQRGMFAVTVRDKLAYGGIKPIFEPTGRNSRYYLKSDVLNFDLAT